MFVCVRACVCVYVCGKLLLLLLLPRLQRLGQQRGLYINLQEVIYKFLSNYKHEDTDVTQVMDLKQSHTKD